MKIVKIVGAAFAVLIVLFLAIPAILSPHMHMERSIEINAPAEKVFTQVTDWENFKKWDPFSESDPTSKATYEGQGVGARYEWAGEKTGKGRMTLASMEPGKFVSYDMEFMEPMQGQAKSDFKFESTATGTRVTWSFDEDLTYLNRYWSLLTDMMMGPAFEKGLQNLKARSEAQ
jgi:uncharacterized protein YndB with AHSA1/START domain